MKDAQNRLFYQVDSCNVRSLLLAFLLFGQAMFELSKSSCTIIPMIVFTLALPTLISTSSCYFCLILESDRELLGSSSSLCLSYSIPSHFISFYFTSPNQYAPALSVQCGAATTPEGKRYPDFMVALARNSKPPLRRAPEGSSAQIVKPTVLRPL
jgi:hypothetical protein